jgi:UDP-glucuronate 4-epimerase
MSNPEPYISTNINGFFNVIRMAYTYNVPNFFYASSSSVYGDLAAIRLPMIEGDAVIHPKSIYAATKVSNEAVANSFAAMNSGMNIIGLRIFNTYGEYSRTDTAPFIFMKSINDQYPITLFKHGDALRDFMHINDLVNCLVTLLPASEANRIPHTVFNIGTGESISIGDLLHVICKVMGRTTTVNMLEDQPAGSVEYQCSDSSKFFNFIGRPNPKFVDPVEGITRMYEWFIHHNPDSDGY